MVEVDFFEVCVFESDVDFFFCLVCRDVGVDCFFDYIVCFDGVVEGFLNVFGCFGFVFV